MLHEPLVAAREVVVAKPSSSVGGERRRMYRLQNEMARAVYQLCLRARIATPKDEDKSVAVGGEGAYGGVGKLLPAVALMACSLMGAHRQRSVEQQHALPCPSREVARRWNRFAEVEFNLLENVLERRRKSHSVGNGEAQSLRLARLMVGVLTYYHHLHLVEGTEIEGVEDEGTRRIACALGIFLAHEVAERGEVRLLKLSSDVLAPRVVDFYVHSGMRDIG